MPNRSTGTGSKKKITWESLNEFCKSKFSRGYDAAQHQDMDGILEWIRTD